MRTCTLRSKILIRSNNSGLIKEASYQCYDVKFGKDLNKPKNLKYF